MSKRVVVIDDNHWQGDSFSRTLQKAGYRVAIARDGHRAIDVIDDSRPDVILLDMILGDTTAPALLHELQSHHDLATIPVIVVTNIAERVPYEYLVDYGVVAVLDKTKLDPEDIVIEVRKASNG